jgi:hypothetical protein
MVSDSRRCNLPLDRDRMSSYDVVLVSVTGTIADPISI